MIEDQRIIKIDDGDMPIFIAAPDGAGPHPGVIVYMDVFGFRQELFDICRRFAASGYVAVLPHLFHRLGAPDFAPANRRDDIVDPRAQDANGATTIAMSARDTGAIIDFLDRDGVGSRVGELGAIGYCMGGRHALAAAAAVPDAISAAASIHGGRLVTGDEDSPHLLLKRIRAQTYLAFATDDDTCPDDHQRLLEETARAAGSHIRCEKLNAHHGWSFPERWCFNRAASDLVWERALQMFRTAVWTPHEPRLRG